MFSSFFSFYFYIIHSFLRPQRKLFSTIVTTNAINVIPLFLLNFCSKFISFPPFPFSVFHTNYGRQKQAKQTYCFIGLFCLLLLFILFFLKLPVCNPARVSAFIIFCIFIPLFLFYFMIVFYTILFSLTRAIFIFVYFFKSFFYIISNIVKLILTQHQQNT